MNTKWVIYWKNPITGASGNGEPISRYLADAWIKQFRDSNDGFNYWMVPKF